MFSGHNIEYFKLIMSSSSFTIIKHIPNIHYVLGQVLSPRYSIWSICVFSPKGAHCPIDLHANILTVHTGADKFCRKAQKKNLVL